MQSVSRSPIRRTLAMAALILAGEAVFIPAFHLGRYFKSSLMATFAIDESQLGDLFSIYGIVAMACYALGGPIADRFAPRTLLAGSLLVTGAGSLYMATFPSLTGLKWLYAFWGASTILAFWAPLIRATREWGGEASQGRAFGVLDGGRGLAAALIATVATVGFATLFGDDALDDPAQERRAVLTLLVFYAVVCGVAALGVWLFVPREDIDRSTEAAPKRVHREFAAVLRQPAVWLQALVVVTAYSAFKTFDFYGLYAEDAFGLSKTQSANLTTGLSYLRFVGAIGAGLVADRLLGVSSTVAVCFGALAVSYGVFVALPPSESLYAVFVANLAVSATACFALRGIYFALLEESGIPRRLTGTAVGVVSLVGFTPEIFMSKLTGVLVKTARDGGDVLVGYHRVFVLLAAFAVAGLIASLLLRRRSR